MKGFKQHEPCPNCGSADNLARYHDGSAWCFGCHYRERRDASAWIPATSTESSLELLDHPSKPDDCGTSFSETAVEWLDEIRAWRASGVGEVPREWLTRGAALTMLNAAVFDAANGYAGCLPGILEVLRRQGLVRGTWTFDIHEQLAPGQADAIARIAARFPELTDDEFVAEHLDEWLS